MSPGEPHAYIKGELVECMMNSDNVVRCGLTPKPKDTETLYQMLFYDMTEKKPVKGKRIMEGDHFKVLEYKSGWDEFRLFKIDINGPVHDLQLKFNSFTIGMVLQGEGHLEFEEDFGSFPIEMYCAYYIMPEKTFRIVNEKSEPLVIYLANCDV